MKVLIVGTGVIGTIYGWALHEAGVDVTHYVRKGKALSDEATIDILDERKDHPKYQKTVYPWKTAESVDGRYDLVIVPTNWYQTGEALKEIAPLCPRSFFYILTSNWTGTDIFDGILDRSRYILGYPDGGGTIREGMYWANIGPEIHIAAPSDGNKDVFEMIGKAFGKAEIKLDAQENMLHWLWVHNAGSAAIWAAFRKYGDTSRYLADRKLLKESFLATRECLMLCEKRGAYSKKYPEIAAFKWPMWLLIPVFRMNIKYNESMKRYTAHAEKAPVEDLRLNYRDILQTAREMDFPMPHFESLAVYM
jgi:ketopantoate reductase